MRLGDQCVEFGQHTGAHAEMAQVESAGFLVKQTQHGALAMAGRQGGDAHVYRFAAYAQGNASILRQALFGDVQLRHDLDARDQRCMDGFLGPHDIAQRAVDAKTHDRNLLKRFDVDIRSLFPQGLRQERIDHADHGRIIGRFEQVFNSRHIEHELGQVKVGLDFIDHLGRIAAGTGVGFGNGRIEFIARHGFQLDAAIAPAHFGNRARFGCVRDPDFNRWHSFAVDRVDTAREQGEIAREGKWQQAGF